MISKIATKLIRFVKKDFSYSISPEIEGKNLTPFLVLRFFSLLRGYYWRRRFKSCGKWLFVGKGAKMRCPGKITAGRGVTIDEGVTINALSFKGVELGNYVTIRAGSIIECSGVLNYIGEGIKIGNNTGISQYAFIGARGFITIGDNVLIGPRVTIYSENHVFRDPNELIYRQGVSRKGINIGDDVWIGTGVTILDGVTVGRGSVIAAGAIVTRDIPEYSIAVGIPARVVRSRRRTNRENEGSVD